MSGNDPTDLAEGVGDAQDQFEYGRGTVEAGFEEVDSAAIAQLRKACRLLAAARTLREADAMFELAVVTHEFLRDHPRDHYDCLCK